MLTQTAAERFMMTISLNHTIVHASDPSKTAAFMVEILDLPPFRKLAHFTVVQVGETSLDLIQTDAVISSRHFAFLVSEADFDAIFDRLRARGLPYWADPFHKQPDAINHWDDGRGLYFDDPDGHLLEIITRSYGSGGLNAANPNPLLFGLSFASRPYNPRRHTGRCWHADKNLV